MNAVGLMTILRTPHVFIPFYMPTCSRAQGHGGQMEPIPALRAKAGTKSSKNKHIHFFVINKSPFPGVIGDFSGILEWNERSGIIADGGRCMQASSLSLSV